ncbi:MAG: hypothetical protein ABSG53_11010 [Thermoguttaceae bacterium]|jgi:hypothetical protein
MAYLHCRRFALSDTFNRVRIACDHDSKRQIIVGRLIEDTDCKSANLVLKVEAPFQQVAAHGRHLIQLLAEAVRRRFQQRGYGLRVFQRRPYVSERTVQRVHELVPVGRLSRIGYQLAKVTGDPEEDESMARILSQVP